jgi:hypothetical protein
MAQQIINVGLAPNDGDGNPLRTAFIKCNDNFGELYARAQVDPPPTLTGSIGDQAGFYAYDATYFYYCYADYDGSTQIWNQLQNAGNISATEISFGLSSVDIPSPSANVIITVNSVEIADFTDSSGGGMRISGFGNVAGNISGANLRTAGQVTATGNVTGNNIISLSNISATGNVVSSNSITSQNMLVGGLISAAGNITGNYILGNGSQLTGLPATYGNANVAVYLPTYRGNLVATELANGTSTVHMDTANGNVDITVTGTNVASFTNSGGGGMRITGFANILGNISGANLKTAGMVSAVGNIITDATVSVAGNITGALFIGNGAGLTGVVAVGNVGAATQVSNGTSSFNIPVANGNLIGNINGNTNIYIFSELGANINGYANITGNVRGGNLSTTGLVTATGNITGGNLTTPGRISSFGNVFTSDSVIASGNLSATGNVIASTVQATIVSASGNVTGGNLITTGALSVAVFSSAGNITGGNLISSGVITATGNINGANLTSAGRVLATGNISGGNLTTGAQVVALGNITGGNLLSTGLISATGNITSANLITGLITATGNIITTGNVTGNYFIGNGSQLTGIDATLIQNGTSNVRLVSANGNATVNINGTANVAVFATTGQYVTGLISATGNIIGGNLIQNGTRVYKWTTAANTAPTNAVPGDEWYNSFTDKLYKYINDGTGNQWVDQSFPSTFGTLAVTGAATIGGTLGVTGNIDAGNFVTTGTVSVTSITKTGSNAAGNIGSSSNYFNTVFAKATSAQYADLAEHYQADAEYEPGTVVVFGGEKEVTVSDISHDTRVAGVVSTSPAYLMNAGNPGVVVALLGRVPCQVQGPVAKGDRLVNLSNGVAGKFNPDLAQIGCVIGKSLESIHDQTLATIEIAVGRT